MTTTEFKLGDGKIQGLLQENQGMAELTEHFRAEPGEHDQTAITPVQPPGD